MDGLWDPPPPYVQEVEDPISISLPYDVIEETEINMKCCIHALEILINQADINIVEHEKELYDLLSQLACTDEVFSNMFSTSLIARIDFLESAIRKLKDDDENFLSTSWEPAESLNDILKSVFCQYIQKKDLQFADITGTASSSECQVPADEKQQTGSSSNANQMEKLKPVDITPVEKQTISLAIVEVKEENTNFCLTDPLLPKYIPQSLCWGSTKKNSREVTKLKIKSPMIMKKDILQKKTPRCNSICPQPSLATQGKQKHQLSIIKSQTYDESMSLATVPYSESMSLTTVPCGESMSLTTVPYSEGLSLTTVPYGESMSLTIVPYGENMSLATVPHSESMSSTTVPYGESMSLTTVPYGESMSLATVPYVASYEETNSILKEPAFPPGYPKSQNHQNQGTSRSQRRDSTSTYSRRKKSNSPMQTGSKKSKSPLQTSLKSHPLAPVVASPLDRPETYSNQYTQDHYSVSDLRDIARQQKLKGYYKMRKGELAQALGIKLIKGSRKHQKRRETQLIPKIKCEP